MKIKNFESLNLDISNGYTEEIENKIEKFNASEEKTRYYVTSPDDKDPLSRGFNTTLEQALDRMNELNKLFSKEYCIFESRVKALRKNDIDLQLKAKKYNL